MAPDTAPAVTAVKAVLAALPCVQAGWAFGVPADGQGDWLHMAAIAAVEAAAPHIRADERQRFAQLAEQVGATYPVPPAAQSITVGTTVILGDGYPPPPFRSFADLLRKDHP